MFFGKYIKYRNIIKIVKSIKKIELIDFEQLKEFYVKMALLITTIENYHKDILNFSKKQKILLARESLDIIVMYNKVISPFIKDITILINNNSISDQTKADLIKYAKSNIELSQNIIKALDNLVTEVL